MTNETKERIKYYQGLLPKWKEKVAGAALMLVVAMTVTVTATYAWITLSTAPEVTNINTTVTSNGSLEIALANGTGKAPGQSAVGDSSEADNSVREANVTWGNLINLTDPSYGLSKITLRPAALKGKSGLLTSPLYGVGYGEDGRVSSMISEDDFAYVYYDAAVNNNQGAFLADLSDNHLGVRAISTVKYTNTEGQAQMTKYLSGINTNLSKAKNNYANIISEEKSPGKEYVNSLQGLIQAYAQNILDSRDLGISSSQGLKTLDVSEYIPVLYEMMKDIDASVMEPAAEGYLQMANLLDVLHSDATHTGDAGYENTEALMKAAKGGKLKAYEKEYMGNLSAFAKDYCDLKEKYLLTGKSGGFSDLTADQKKYSLAYWASQAQAGVIVYWGDIENIINWIVDINSATLDGYTLTSLSSMSIAVKVVTGSNPHAALAKGGILLRIEQSIGQRMSPTLNVTLDASSIVSLLNKVPLSAVLRTDAKEPYGLETDREKVKGLYSGSFKGTDATAEDTYAMALDFWVRTNAGSKDGQGTVESVESTDEEGNKVITTVTTSAEQAYLTLEGAVKVLESSTPEMTRALDENEYPVYTASFKYDGNSTSQDVYLKDGKYYFISEGEEVEFSEYIKDDAKITDVSYAAKMKVTSEIIGYEGVNRVWSEEQMAYYEGTGTSTTQGAGSCYVFYADTPADQQRFLELLGSMRVVFIDGDGKQVGLATLDTKNYYAETGKVTVPLVLDRSLAKKLGTDTNGNEIYGMMSLTKNAATRITALVYLDGTSLTNDMVLASGDIQGTLNLQFGSSTALERTTKIETTDKENNKTEVEDTEYIPGSGESEAVKDEDVMSRYIELSASISPSGPVDYDSENPAKTTLSVKVEGVEPKKVSARFIRKISSTQGVLQEAIDLSGSGADWSTECSFQKPGTYVLRSAWVDGVEYELNSPVEFTVVGSSVNSLTCDAIKDGSRFATIMTADNSFSTKMTLGFSSNGPTPSRCNGIFMDAEGRQVNVPFKLEGGTWIGTAKFTTSGTFTMEYVEIDGEIFELRENLVPTMEILLGLKVRTWITAEQETIEKLKNVFENATPTSFVYDQSKTGDVTLKVSAQIYDNDGNEITELGGVRLYYGQAGALTSVTGLDSDMKWTASSGRYEGAFEITKAGTFRFTKLTIGENNTVEKFTEAPSIQVMPPDDVSYYGNATESYQYAPKLDGAMKVQLAYSSASTKVEAEIEKVSTSVDAAAVNEVKVVEGTQSSTEDLNGKSVTTWKFVVPQNLIGERGYQEGEWRVNAVTLYDVYYAGSFRESVRLDLTNENITSKIVNYMNVVLDVGTASRTFTGEFMADHKVSGMTVEIADYEGKPIEGIEISNLKLTYTRNSNSTLDTYGYQCDDLGTVTLESTGTLLDGSQTKYGLSEMNFQYVGNYASPKISFNVKTADSMNAASNITAGSANSGTTLTYHAGGTASEIPTYDVKWNLPEVQVTGVSPAKEKTFDITASSDEVIENNEQVTQTDVTNWNSTYAAVVFMKYCKNGLGVRYFEIPKVSLKLASLSDRFEKVELSVDYPAGDSATENYKYVFSSLNASVSQSIGYAEGNTSFFSTLKHYETGKQIINTVQVTGNDKKVWTAKLAHELVINQPNTAPELVFTGLNDYPNAPIPSTIKTSSSGVKLSEDGSNSMTVTLPKKLEWTQEEIKAGELTLESEESETSQVHTEGGMPWSRTYKSYNRTVTTKRESTIKTVYELNYTVDRWKIGGKTYDFDTQNILISDTGINAIPEIQINKEQKSSDKSTLVTITTTDVYLDNTKKGSKVDKDEIHETPFVETRWE